jgi:maltose alpha-D-glucosyltransferase / alpha-amylase
MEQDWDDLLRGAGRTKLEASLVHYLKGRRWFPPGRDVKAVQIREVIQIGPNTSRSELLILNVEFLEGEPQEHVLPVAIAPVEKASVLERDAPQLIIARVRTAGSDQSELIYEAVADEGFCREMLRLFARKRAFSVADGQLQAIAGQSVRTVADEEPGPEPLLRRADQHHSTIVYGNRLFLKLYRRIEPGVNPELQVARFLARKGFAQGPNILGWLEFRRKTGDSVTVASLREFIPEARDAWIYMVETVTRYFERVRALPGDFKIDPTVGGTLLETMAGGLPENVVRVIGTPLELARILGQRTAEMHLVLASEPENKDFAPEPFTPFYQRSLFQSLRNTIVGTTRLLRRNMDAVPDRYRDLAHRVLGIEQEAVTSLRPVHATLIDAKRIRCHDNYHLEQLLYTGKDFLVVNFEGDPTRSFGERRIKHSSLYDIASMLRSFDQVSAAALMQQVAIGALDDTDMDSIIPWSSFWSRWVSAAFLKRYFQALGKTDLLPDDLNESAVLLKANLIGRCFHELGSDLLNRPNWVGVPLRSILQIVRPEATNLPALFGPPRLQ